eukprot:s3353_g5.t1
MVVGEQVEVQVVVEVVSGCGVKCSREVKVEKGEVEVKLEALGKAQAQLWEKQQAKRSGIFEFFFVGGYDYDKLKCYEALNVVDDGGVLRALQQGHKTKIVNEWL